MGKHTLVELMMNQPPSDRKKVYTWLRANVYGDEQVMEELHRVTGRRHLSREDFLRELKRAKELSSKQVEIIVKYNPLAHDVEIF
jgi:hypothetical protein